MDLKERLSSYIKTHGISQNKAAAGIGYEGSVISQWLSGTYKGNTQNVEERVAAWLDLQEAADKTPDLPLVSLTRMATIKAACRIAHEEKDIALIVGDSGTAKSTSLAEYCAENRHNTVLIKVDHTFTHHTLINELARGLGVDSSGTESDIASRIVSTLLERDMLVVVDEADYLTDTSLELLRIVVNDKGRTGLVLAGLTRMKFRIKNLKNDHRQLENRIGVFKEVEPMDASDAAMVIRSVWPETDELLIQLFVKHSRKSLHRLVRLVKRVRRTLKANGKTTPEAEIVNKAAELLMEVR